VEIGVFIPSGSQFDNQIPDGHQRKGSVFWSFLQPMLRLPEEHLPWHNEGVSPAIMRIREYEARRLAANNATLPQVTLADLASDAVEHVREAVRRVTKTEKARAWLSERLQHGPVDAATIETEGLKAGFTLKMLKQVKEKLRVVSVRKGANFWRWRLPTVKESRADEA